MVDTDIATCCFAGLDINIGPANLWKKSSSPRWEQEHVVKEVPIPISTPVLIKEPQLSLGDLELLPPPPRRPGCLPDAPLPPMVDALGDLGDPTGSSDDGLNVSRRSTRLRAKEQPNRETVAE